MSQSDRILLVFGLTNLGYRRARGDRSGGAGSCCATNESCTDPNQATCSACADWTGGRSGIRAFDFCDQPQSVSESWSYSNVTATAARLESARSGTPKGRTRRTVPMTSTLVAALKRLSVVRAGFVLRDSDGAQLSDGVCCKQIRRICRRAGLPERGWHVLRHSFGTHAAMFGVNPWKLMTWMGHKRIDETMLYVNFAGNHLRQLPHEIIAAPQNELDPDRRIVAMLGARGTVVALEGGAEKEVLRC